MMGSMVRKREWSEGEPFFKAEDWDPEQHPALASVSCGMMGLRAVPVLKAALPGECVQIRAARSLFDDAISIAAQTFNMTWQSGAGWGNWRGGFFRYDDEEDWPEPIRKVLERCDDTVTARFVPTGSSP